MKRGFGILEVLVAAVVLGFLIVGLTQLQKGNREAVLRIRSRDAAQIIAQDFLDSLSKVGISSIPNTITGTKDYRWEGQVGIAPVTYTIEANITSVGSGKPEDSSNLKANNLVTAKNIDLKVSWPFKSSTQNISVSRIIK